MGAVGKAIGLTPEAPKAKTPDPAKAKAEELAKAREDREKAVRAALESGKSFNTFTGSFGAMTEGRKTFG